MQFSRAPWEKDELWSRQVVWVVGVELDDRLHAESGNEPGLFKLAILTSRVP